MPRKTKPLKHGFDYDLIVIGSGISGSTAATMAAKAGKSVAIIEEDTFGGDSPNFGDVPTNALLNVASIFDQATRAGRFGLRTSTLGYNYPTISNWKDAVVGRTGLGNNRKFYENLDIATYQGKAHFLTHNEITVNRRHLSAAYFLVASGSTWTVPDITGLENISYFTPRSILQTLRPPKSLLIIGGGKHGVEIAQLMAIFGTKVYIAEKAGRLLPSMDPEVGELIEKVLAEKYGVEVLTHSRVTSVAKEGLGKKITISRGETDRFVRADELLIAAGRQANVDFGLENAAIAFNPKGIEVNDNLQTSNKRVFVAGDVLGRGSSTQAAMLEARVAVNNMFERTKTAPDYTASPRVIFTTPEIAQVGMNEDDCRRRDLAINKALAPLSMAARSNTTDTRDGFVKLITDKKGVVVGGTVVGPSAGEIIHEIALAVKWRLSATQLAETPHAFLSWAEVVRAAAAKLA